MSSQLVEGFGAKWIAVVIGVLAFGLSTALVPALRWAARKINAVDHAGEGKAHSGATPYFGGIAIGLAVLSIPPLFQGWQSGASAILLAALMVSLTGLVDDLKDIGAIPRLTIEFLAASLAVGAGARVEFVGGWLGKILSVIGIVLVTNSFNLLDNMDGCAAVVAAAASAGILGVALVEKQTLVAGLAAGIVGSCFGFLVYNWHPASIFMGDAGSLFLGFLISVAALKLRVSMSTGFQSATGVLLMLAVPLFDTTLVVISRTRRGRSILLGGRDHLSHRLHLKGAPVRLVAATIGFISVLSSAAGYLVLTGRLRPSFVAAPLAVSVVAGLALLLRVEVYFHGSTRQRDQVCVPGSDNQSLNVPLARTAEVQTHEWP